METMDINGHDMPVDEKNRVKLTDLWIMAGRPGNRKPSIFKRLKRVRSILGCAEWFATRGRHAATWAHYHLARQYAAYLNLEPPPRPRSAATDMAAAASAAHAPDEQGEEFAGEAWKGDYDPETAGEEWKSPDDADSTGPKWRKGASGAEDEFGLDDLLFDFVDIPGFLRIRASVN